MELFLKGMLLVRCSARLSSFVCWQEWPS